VLKRRRAKLCINNNKDWGREGKCVTSFNALSYYSQSSLLETVTLVAEIAKTYIRNILIAGQSGQLYSPPPPRHYTTHSGYVFYSPLSGFSLLVYEVT
jgi:hypothetical protein